MTVHDAATQPSTSPSVTTTMRAAVQRTYTDPSALAVESVPTPSPGPRQVLIAVDAAAVDRGVWHLATGRPFIMRAMGFGLTRPRQPIQGTDVAGVVVSVGSEVTRFAAGDAVMGSADGSFAEFALASQDSLTHTPSCLSAREAAATAVSGLAAHGAVVDLGRVDAGQRVLVLGASGGVGSFAVQLAVSAGATVTGVASRAKAAFVASLGASSVVDYATTDVTALGERYDVIIDAGGLAPLRRLRRALTPTGTLVIVGGEGGGSFAGGFGRQLAAAALSLVTRQRLTFLMSTTTADGLARLVRRIEAGDVRPSVTAAYSLDRVGEALADLTAGRIAGKSVIDVSSTR